MPPNRSHASLDILARQDLDAVAAPLSVMTGVVSLPPGDPGTPPHRHPGPVFAYMLEGELRFALEGEPTRIVRAGDGFWEPGGDVVHTVSANNLLDRWSRFVVVALSSPGDPALTMVRTSHQ